MEIKETVKTKLGDAKDKSIAFVKKAWPYASAITVTAGILGIVYRESYLKAYSRGFCDGKRLGQNTVIKIINDLAKSVETK